MIYTKTDDLKEGMVLANTIYDNNETILLKSNIKLNDFYISRIKELNYDGVYVYEDDYRTTPTHILSERTRIRTLKALKQLNIEDCIFLANEIVDEVRSQKNVIVEMINLSTFDNYTYMHSINVDMLSVILGVAAGLTNDELRKLSQAALMHDIGKIKIDLEILNKPGRLNVDEYSLMQNHPEYGYNILHRHPDVSSVVRNAVLSHHENEDGTGYPRQLAGNNIHKFAKIIHVADVYDALTAKRVYKDALNPADAIEYLMANVNSMFNRSLVEMFIKYIAPYPVGIRVLLSTKQCAHIHENHPEALLRPTVRLDDGTLINLMDVLNITILKCL